MEEMPQEEKIFFSKNQDEKMQQPMLPETMVVDFTTSVSFYLSSASLKIN
jgi:hypothetical protein